jgi:hypothetical protein
MLHKRDARRSRHMRVRQVFSRNRVRNLLVWHRKPQDQEFSSNSLHGHRKLQGRVSIYSPDPRNTLQAWLCILHFRM